MAGLIFRAKFVIFLSTLSLRRATSAPAIKSCWSSYFYPRSPCGERHHLFWYCAPQRNFYPRSPCGERPLSLLRSVMFMALFLSTLSLRRATWHLCFCIPCQCNFYPRSPCGERRLQLFLYYQDNTISIHALLAESDFFDAVQIVIVIVFLSTLSLRRATRLFFIVFDLFRFLSTLSLRRATTVPGGGHISKSNFYPRSPCGERHF